MVIYYVCRYIVNEFWIRKIIRPWRCANAVIFQSCSSNSLFFSLLRFLLPLLRYSLSLSLSLFISVRVCVCVFQFLPTPLFYLFPLLWPFGHPINNAYTMYNSSPPFMTYGSHFNNVSRQKLVIRTQSACTYTYTHRSSSSSSSPPLSSSPWNWIKRKEKLCVASLQMCRCVAVYRKICNDGSLLCVCVCVCRCIELECWVHRGQRKFTVTRRKLIIAIHFSWRSRKRISDH